MDEFIKNCIPDELRYLAQIVHKAGYEFYVVGGFVRDIFLGSCDAHKSDIDTAGNCSPDEFAKLIANDKTIHLCEANYPLGTLKIVAGKIDIEYTCFRKESYRGDGHHTPSEIAFTNDIKSDASRRDFTINSLYLDLLTCRIVDFFDGRKHIEKKVIKTIRDSTVVFAEDALRILRMCRFSAKLGFAIDQSTIDGAKQCAPLLNSISKERIGVELDEMLWETEHPRRAIEVLYTAEINKIICSSVKKETALSISTVHPDRYLRWSLFLSDLSPGDARRYILSLSQGKDLAKEIAGIIADRNITEKNKNDIILHFAVIGEAAAKRRAAFVSVFSQKEGRYLEDTCRTMSENKQFINMNMLKINGTDIIEILNVKGAEIKHYKNQAYEYAVLNPKENNYDHLKAFLQNVKRKNSH